MSRLLIAFALCAICALASAAEPRARDLGIPSEGSPGPLDAITDIAGLTVGEVTLVEDLADGKKVRTGGARDAVGNNPPQIPETQ